MEVNNQKNNFSDFTYLYLNKFNNIFDKEIIEKIYLLSNDLKKAWDNGNNVFICGNGGSAGNAMHIANDFHYGVGSTYKNKENKENKDKILPGLKIYALPSNPSIITCLANDIGYENIYSHQLKVLGNKNDILIVLSGSGNSTNIINALFQAKKLNIKSYAVVAFDGGKCKDTADNTIHFKISDMQIAEDSQLIIFHICMQWLSKTRVKEI